MPESLGLQSREVRVVAYDPVWPELYAAEIERLEHILLPRRVSLVFEHTGSTAVPRLVAKPVLDILAAARAEDDRGPIIAALQAAGYSYRGEQGVAGRNFFRRGVPRQYHIHLTSLNSAFWRDHLAFRDYLRSYPDAAADYAALKFELALRYPRDREAYIEGKTSFVEAILAGCTRTGNSANPPAVRLTEP